MIIVIDYNYQLKLLKRGALMNNILISDEAFEEFKSFLDENKVENYNIRIYFAGNSCSGAVFNVSVEEPQEGDVLEQIKDISFIIKQELIDEFTGFTILSNDENGGRGLALRPLNAPEGGCDTCGGCH